jgi:hypothetical protein
MTRSPSTRALFPGPCKLKLSSTLLTNGNPGCDGFVFRRSAMRCLNAISRWRASGECFADLYPHSDYAPTTTYQEVRSDEQLVGVKKHTSWCPRQAISNLCQYFICCGDVAARLYITEWTFRLGAKISSSIHHASLNVMPRGGRYLSLMRLAPRMEEACCRNWSVTPSATAWGSTQIELWVFLF